MVLYLLAFVISTRLPTVTEKQMLSVRLSRLSFLSLLGGDCALCVCVCVYASEQWSCPVMRLRLLLFKRSLLIILRFIVCARVCVYAAHKKRERKRRRDNGGEGTKGSNGNLQAIQQRMTHT